MPTLLALDRVLTRPTNEQLGRYQLLGRLGAGGMAEVFVARCGELAGMQSLVAVKRILPHLAEDEAFVRAFVREAKLASLLQHAKWRRESCPVASALEQPIGRRG